MKLEEMTWIEVEEYLARTQGVILPVGSVEQHGPIGLIGTDAICAREIAWSAAAQCGAIVAPELAYGPAPFNMGFPGTLSIPESLFGQLASAVIDGLIHHGFTKIYVLNGHGANLAPLASVVASKSVDIRIRSWWDFDAVNDLRRAWYGEWEGMHATPSEVAITQATHRVIPGDGLAPPKKLSTAYMLAHAGDKHGPPDDHRRVFPDGRVGSHSGLATPEHGALLLQSAAKAVAADFMDFLG